MDRGKILAKRKFDPVLMPSIRLRNVTVVCQPRRLYTPTTLPSRKVVRVGYRLVGPRLRTRKKSITAKFAPDFALPVRHGKKLNLSLKETSTPQVSTLPLRAAASLCPRR